MGVEIAQQRVADAIQTFRPGDQTWITVYTQTQNLGLRPCKPVFEDFVGGYLTRSDWRQGHTRKKMSTTSFCRDNGVKTPSLHQGG